MHPLHRFSLSSFSHLLFNKVCPLSLFSRTAVGGSGGEVVPAGRDPLPEGEAESQRLSGRLHHGHHWQEAAAAAESDGAASGGELQVHTHTMLHNTDIYIRCLTF